MVELFTALLPKLLLVVERAYKKIQDLKIVPDMDHRKEKNDGNG